MELKETLLSRVRKKVIKEVSEHTVAVLFTGDLITFAGVCLLIKDLITKSSPIGSGITILIGAGIMIEAIDIGVSDE